MSAMLIEAFKLIEDERCILTKENVELTKKIRELEAKLAALTPPVCSWCRSTKHTTEKCGNAELMKPFHVEVLGPGQFYISRPGISCGRWVVVIAKDSYAVLAGTFVVSALYGCEPKPLTFGDGVNYANDSAAQKFEWLTCHEYQKIKELEPELATWLVEQKLWI